MLYNQTCDLNVLVSDDDALAQHCFIKSVELDASNAVGWCNLGFLYLKYKEALLAHKAFSKAQSVQPLYAYSWTGQVIWRNTHKRFREPT